MPELVMIGASHKTSPVAFRERLAFGSEEMTPALQALARTRGVRECVIVSTCNRVEIYASMDEPEPATLLGFLTGFHGQPADESPFVYAMQGQEAVRHLCRVAAGIDSLVLGEPEVFGQVKDAYRAAVEASVVGAGFRILFPLVFSLVKKIRSRSAAGGLSVAGVAVRLAKEIFGRLDGRRVLVMGAGKMGEQAVRSLKKEGVGEVLVSNRTFYKAVVLAEQVGGTPIMLHEVPQYAQRADILISSLGSSQPVLTTAAVDSCLRGRKEPLLLIDIAVPRSIDPLIAGLEGARLYNIDDLVAVADSNAEQRRKDAEAAEAIIEPKSAEIYAKFASNPLNNAFRDIRSEAEELRRRRLEDAIAGLDVSDENRRLIDSLTRSIVNGVLHRTISRLREETVKQDLGQRT